MDNVTHTLFAATLARTPLGRAGRGTLMALVVGSNAPDVDVLSTLRDGRTYLEWHRGPTHGPVGITGLTLATAAMVWLGVGLRDTSAQSVRLLHELDVLDARFQRPAGGEIFWRRAVRYPDQWTPATFAAAWTATARAFLGSSRFPAARSYVDPSGVATVRWNDMRFVGGLLVNSARRPSFFTVLVRIGPDGRVLQETIGQ